MGNAEPVETGPIPPLALPADVAARSRADLAARHRRGQDATPQDRRTADALVRVIDHAGRLLISADYGTSYQLGEARALHAAVAEVVACLVEDHSYGREESLRQLVADKVNVCWLGRAIHDAGLLTTMAATPFPSETGEQG
jgi:hypothetical protein